MIAASLAVFAVALAQGPGDSMLVSTEWLAARLHDRNLVLLHVGDRAGYDSMHIPGARHLTHRDVATPQGSEPALELLPPAELAAILESRGVSDDSRIVLYWGGGWVTPTARVYLTLHWAGLGARTSVLQGGLPQWRKEGRPVTADKPAAARGSLTVRPRADVIVDAPWVATRLADAGVAVVDARTPNFYAGADTNYTRPGHIAGAINVPFSTVVTDDLHILPADSLRVLFRAAGAAPGQTVVTYCHIGQQASLVWFAARLAGYAARMYDGSFTEWDKLERYPVEKQ